MSKDLVLEIDAGNTAVKWRFYSDPSSQNQQCTRSNYLDFFNQLSSALIAANHVAFARVVSVAGAAFDGKLASFLESHSIDVQFARVESSVSGVRCGYEDTSQLGVDRWVAILAASGLCSSAKMIVDLGSALTIDFLSKEHNHLGGYIVPGWGLMQLALENGTQINHDRIPLNYSANEIKPGKSTLDAIGMGRIKLITSVIESAYEDFLRAQVEDEKVVLVCTGGDIDKIKPHLTITDILFVEHLVLEGLSVSIGGNQSS